MLCWNKMLKVCLINKINKNILRCVEYECMIDMLHVSHVYYTILAWKVIIVCVLVSTRYIILFVNKLKNSCTFGYLRFGTDL